MHIGAACRPRVIGSQMPHGAAMRSTPLAMLALRAARGSAPYGPLRGGLSAPLCPAFWNGRDEGRPVPASRVYLPLAGRTNPSLTETTPSHSETTPVSDSDTRERNRGEGNLEKEDYTVPRSLHGVAGTQTLSGGSWEPPPPPTPPPPSASPTARIASPLSRPAGVSR